MIRKKKSHLKSRKKLMEPVEDTKGKGKAVEDTTVEEEAESSSSKASTAQLPTAAPLFISKHRLIASISCLENQISLILEEQEDLETTDNCSTVCNELLTSVESIPDPLLAVTRGPVDASCDRWFGSSRNPLHRRRCIRGKR